jgi:hypothetical protein
MKKVGEGVVRQWELATGTQSTLAVVTSSVPYTPSPDFK